jgi:NAD(P)-dependent dehydrogenase (short-subunit alcohol dehydrogenase family)
MDLGMKGRTAVVTGAARGMGKALAVSYAKQGVNVVLMDINKEGIDAAAEEIAGMGVKAWVVPVDMSNMQDVLKAVKTIDEITDSVEILGNCAGISTSKLMNDVELDEWDRVMNVNLKSTFLLSREVAKLMIRDGVKNGKIISISSQASKIGELGNGVYCVSKAAMNMLAQVMALELAEHGICVNTVCPGYVNTEMIRLVFEKRGPIEGMTPEEYGQTLIDQVPLKRLCEPEEIADTMVFLSSDYSNYTTGQSITVAGGKTLI